MKTMKTMKTVQEWLNENPNIELIGEVVSEDEPVHQIDANLITVNSNRQIMVRCNTHNYIQSGRIQNICKNKLECCKAKFLFQDWCLLFYKYKFNVNLKVVDYDSGINSELDVKTYTGKQAFEYLEDRSKLPILFINNTEELSFKCPFPNYATESTTIENFNVITKDVCSGKSWCRTFCIGCDKEANKISKSFLGSIKSMNEFLEEYCNDDIKKEIKKECEEKRRLYNSLPNSSTITLDNTINNILRIDIKLQQKFMDIIMKSENTIKNFEKADEDIAKIRNKIIHMIKQVISGKNCNDVLIDNMIVKYARYLIMGVQCYFVIPRKSLSRIRSCYDYIITLNKTTIGALNRGVLYGKPVTLNENYNLGIDLISESELNNIIDELNIKNIKYSYLSDVFNGIAKDSFVDQEFDQDFILSPIIQELETNAFKNCICKGRFELPHNLLTQLAKNRIKSLGKTKLVVNYTDSKKGGVYINGNFGINYVKSQGLGFMQYNDVFKVGEALRVYEDRLTLYRAGEFGGFQEYEYIDGFEYQKFYGNNADNLVISLLLAQYNIVTISEVTDALIDIYNKMNN